MIILKDKIILGLAKLFNNTLYILLIVAIATMLAYGIFGVKTELAEGTDNTNYCLIQGELVECPKGSN